MGANPYFNRSLKQGSYPGRSGLQRLEKGWDGMERLWQTLRQEGPGTLAGLAKRADLSDTQAGYLLSLLETAGYLWREPHRGGCYWLVWNTGEQPPQPQRQKYSFYDPNLGRMVAIRRRFKVWPGEPAAVDSLEQKTWLAMRMLRTFTVSELVTVTEQKPSLIKRRVTQLLSFQYLRKTEPSGGEEGYLLPKYRDTGARAPAINTRMKLLYDYNNKEIIQREGR